MGDGRISVLGEPAAAGFCAGLWAVAGHRVSWHAPARLRQQFLDHGLELTDRNGLDARIGQDVLSCPAEPAALLQADMVIVCDCPAEAGPEMAAHIARHCRPQIPVLSLRSRPCIHDPLAVALPGRAVRAGLLPWEVHGGAAEDRRDRALRFERHGYGPVLVATADPVEPAPGPDISSLDVRSLDVPCLEVMEQEDVAGRIWGRILTDLAQVLEPQAGADRARALRGAQWRGLAADQLQEALMVLQQAGIRPVPPSGLPMWLRLRILQMRGLPDTLVSHLAVWSGRPGWSEVAQPAMASRRDELLRPLLELGRRLGVAMPVHEILATQASTARGGPTTPVAGAILPGDHP